MVASINSTTTKTTGWQKKCWEWAEAHIPFEIHDVQSEHFMFFQELCAEYQYTYNYRCRKKDSIAKFLPKG